MTPGIELATAHRRAVLRLIRACLPDTEVRAYGSRVKRTSRPASDLDLVAMAGPAQRRQVANLREAFEESDLPFSVDVLVWDEIPASFQREIERNSVRLTSSRTTPPASGRSPR
jgi:type I restriction enzyme S subunit